MIFGDCPYCDQPVINHMPEKTPQFGKSICDECGEQYWMYYSRADPKAYTREGFAEKFIMELLKISDPEKYNKELDYRKNYQRELRHYLHAMRQIEAQEQE